MGIPSLRDYEWQTSYDDNHDLLNDFYIPALSHSVRYDRSTGFFSSSALAVAAKGVAALIKNGGVMRLLVGAQLDERDVQAIAQGTSLQGLVGDQFAAILDEPTETLLRKRLEVLAWMVAHDTLRIKVVIPRDADGNPIPASRAESYYHPKRGVFTDSRGNHLAFNGSINESQTGWQRNYESFHVFRSWEEAAHVKDELDVFDEVWEGRTPRWMAFDVPEAARRALMQYAPDIAPELDPLAPEPEPLVVVDVEADLEHERVLFRFLRDIPYFPNSKQLGAATCAIKPWPHQIYAAEQIVATYPRRYMLCDEVGLGKTIEAGLVIRQLVISGYVKRCLILVPKSVSRQWQEELYEKFALDVPLFDGRRFRNYAGEELEWQYSTTNAWKAFDIFIASSQLAKRQDRHDQLVAAGQWDLVVVDEAHHARRKGFKERGDYRPNRLLDVLTDPRFKSRSLLLMTATPMQVDPLEVWDLLKILGLGGKWGAYEDNFVAFYEELRKPFDQVQWDFVFEMLKDYLEHGGQIDPAFEQEVREVLGPVRGQLLMHLPYEFRPAQVLKTLPREAKDLVVSMAHHHTPLRDFMFRNTRDLIREYVRLGYLSEKIPHRRPQPVWIAMSPEEKALYERIEEYISEFYQKYGQRTGLGFIMTVYRRRLTSSFYAVKESLERRLAFLRGQVSDGLVDEDDIEQEDLSLDIQESMDGRSVLSRDEIAYIEDFIFELGNLSHHDSKTEQLFHDLNAVFRERNTVIIFTQYTDTMDYLRDKLLAVYGNQVACYSGRGGEQWNGIAWVPVPKEQVKQAFRRGEDIKILVCTEAASEGLNLQTCGVLINYDMPWNPMRVEQRIGRIDRIGQIFDQVWIYNYFYKDTIEGRVYQALERRINWFTDVVGILQPILALVGETIEGLAMTSRREREERFEREIVKIEEQLAKQDVDLLNVYEETEAVHRWDGFATPITLSELEALLIGSPSLVTRLVAHPEIPGAYCLGEQAEQVVITFRQETFDEHPNTVVFASYGSQILSQMLCVAGEPDPRDDRGIMRLAVSQPVPLVAYFALSAEGDPVLIDTPIELRKTLNNSLSAWSEHTISRASEQFGTILSNEIGRIQTSLQQIHRARSGALAEEAGRLLRQAAYVEIALGQQLDLDGNGYPFGFSAAAVRGLARHRYPLAPLVRLFGDSAGELSAGDSFFQEIYGRDPRKLKAQFQGLRTKAEILLESYDGSTEQEIDLELGPVEMLFLGVN